MTYKEWQHLATGTLSHLDSARLEADLLLMHVLGISRAEIMAWPDQAINAQNRETLNRALQRRADDVPLAYITGIQEFWSLPFVVTPDVLIPRPETEWLVEIGLQHAAQAPERSINILDAGTGSGAIALSIASELKEPRHRIIASDQSTAALAIAKLNADRFQISNVEFVHADWLTPFSPATMDLILSNPPYLSADDPHLQSSIAHEPRNALVSGELGFDAIKQLIQQGHDVLKPGGLLALEHGFEQGAQVREFFSSTGYGNISTSADLSGHERVTMGMKH